MIRKKITIVFLTVILVLDNFLIIALAASTNNLVDAKPTKLVEPAKSAIVIDAKTGQILAEKNQNKVLATASTSKLVTAYLVMQAVKDGKLKWDDKIRIDTNTSSISKNKKLQNIELEEDKEYRVSDLFNSTVNVSTNATAIALGRAVGGNSQNFAKMMNDQVRVWGITNAKFYNAAGLDNSEMENDKLPNAKDTDENIASAQDLAIIAKHLFDNFPEIINVMKNQELNFNQPDGRVDNLKTSIYYVNEHLKPQNFNYIVGKTGTSMAAGSVFVGLTDSLSKGRQLITVVMHASNYKDPSAAYEQSMDAVKQTMAKWESFVIPQGFKIAGATSIPMLNTKDKSIPVRVKDQVNYWLPTSASIQPEFKISFSNQKQVTANEVLLTGTPDNFKGVTYLPGYTDNGYIKLEAETASDTNDNIFGSLIRRLGF